MQRWQPLLLTAAGAAAVAATVLDGGATSAGPTADPRLAHVVEVIDGDEVRARFVSGTVRTVRFIGIDAPGTEAGGERDECHGRRSAARVRRLIPPGERVRLRFDNRRQDHRGRLLAYVFRERDGLFVNAELLRRGDARILTAPPNVRRVRELLAAGRAGRDGRRGLWRACGAEAP